MPACSQAVQLATKKPNTAPAAIMGKMESMKLGHVGTAEEWKQCAIQPMTNAMNNFKM